MRGLIKSTALLFELLPKTVDRIVNRLINSTAPEIDPRQTATLIAGDMDG
jgi:hypothetical protein